MVARLSEIETLNYLDAQLFQYLTYKPTSPYEYPIGKVLLLIALSSGALRPQEQARLTAALVPVITDSVHKELLGW